MKAIRVWYAVDRDGEGYFYTGAPYRDVDSEMWNCDGDAPTATRGGSWRGNDNKFLWTSATDDVFRDCFIPTTTPDKGPLQFEIDEQLNTTWYKE